MAQPKGPDQWLSKALYQALRLCPAQYGIRLPKDGWVPIHVLSKVLGSKADNEKIEKVVKTSMTNSGYRFELRMIPKKGKYVRVCAWTAVQNDGGAPKSSAPAAKAATKTKKKKNNNNNKKPNKESKPIEEAETEANSYASSRTSEALQSEPCVQASETRAPWPPPPPPPAPNPPGPPPCPPPGCSIPQGVPEPPSLSPPGTACQVETSDVASQKPHRRYARSAFDGYLRGPEFLQVNTPTCDGVVGGLFIRLPHKDSNKSWTYGRFEGGRVGWLPSAYLEPYVANRGSRRIDQQISVAHMKIQCLEAELADLRGQLQDAAIQDPDICPGP